MKKKLLFFISFLLFATLFIGLTTNTIANEDDEDYEVGFDVGDEFIYVCKTFDEEKMNDAWGKDWDDNTIFEGIEEGKKMKWEITEIDDDYTMYSPETYKTEDAYRVKYEIWMWSNDEKFSDVDSEEEEFSWLIIPGDHGTDLYFDSILVPWVPIEIEKYLDHLELYKWWYVDEDKLLFEKFGGERYSWYDSDIHKGHIFTETTYNEQGIVSSFKILNEAEEVILEFSLESETAFLIPLIIIIVAVISALAIVYIVMRKKGRKLNLIKKIRRKKTDDEIKEIKK